jgi:hypothetical protein
VSAENSTVKQEHKFIHRQSLNFFEKTFRSRVHQVFQKQALYTEENLFDGWPDYFLTVRQREYTGLLSVFFTFKKVVGNPSKLAFADFRTCRFGEGETNAVKKTR